MPSQWKRLEMAPGHSLLARRVNTGPAIDGCVLVATKHRGRVHVSTDTWNAAELHHG